MTTPSRRRLIEISAWALATFAIVLFVASMTGNGSGLGIGADVGWSWAFLVAIAAAVSVILILAAEPRRVGGAGEVVDRGRS